MTVSLTDGKYALEYNKDGIILTISSYCTDLSRPCLYLSDISLETPIDKKKFKRQYWVNSKTLKLQERWKDALLVEKGEGEYNIVNLGNTSEEMRLCIVRADNPEAGCCVRRTYKANGPQLGLLKRSTVQRSCGDSFVIAHISGVSKGLLTIPLWL